MYLRILQTWICLKHEKLNEILFLFRTFHLGRQSRHIEIYYMFVQICQQLNQQHHQKQFEPKNEYFRWMPIICTDLIEVMIVTLGLTQWNLNSFEFKFDDTRLSSYDYFFLLRSDVALSLPCCISFTNYHFKTVLGGLGDETNRWFDSWRTLVGKEAA